MKHTLERIANNNNNNTILYANVSAKYCPNVRLIRLDMIYDNVISLSLSYNLLKREKKTKQKEAYHIRKLDYEQEMHITFIRINCFDLKLGHFATSSIVFSLLE